MSLLLTLTDHAYGDNFGYTVRGVGDVNADGFDDILVGAPQDDRNGMWLEARRFFQERMVRCSIYAWEMPPTTISDCRSAELAT
jgi:hypothetical protein